MEDSTHVKLEIFVPQEYALKTRDQLAAIGVGRIGEYDHCMAIYTVQGYFRPLAGANSFTGEVGRIQETTEAKVEVNCKRELVKEAIKVTGDYHHCFLEGVRVLRTLKDGVAIVEFCTGS